MTLSENIKPISYLKAKTADVVNDVTTNQKALVITQNGEAKVVIQDIKQYENLQNSLSLLKLIIQSEDEIKKGKKIKQEEMFEDLKKSFLDK